MGSARVPQFLMRVFAPHRPVEFVLKPAMVLAAFLLLFVGLESALFGWTPTGLVERLLTAGLALAPFMLVAFTLVVYLDRLQASMSDLAMTDPLTGLPNRRAFIQDVSRYQRGKEIGFLLIIDADHFKRINDTHGHAVGDACLRAIGDRLDSLMTPGDLIGRIGGEEFGAYLPLATQQDVTKLGKRLCHEITVPHPDGAQMLHFTLSVGATETRAKEPVETALARADEALYVAKETGRARMVIWRPGVRKVA